MCCLFIYSYQLMFFQLVYICFCRFWVLLSLQRELIAVTLFVCVLCVSVRPPWCNTWIHGGGSGRWNGWWPLSQLRTHGDHIWTTFRPSQFALFLKLCIFDIIKYFLMLWRTLWRHNVPLDVPFDIIIYLSWRTLLT